MENLSAYPGLVRKPSGVYAIKMRMPTDIVDLIEDDHAIWNAISVNPGSILYEWRESFVSKVSSSRPVVKREFKRSLGARTLSDAKPAYFVLRSELENAFDAIYAKARRNAVFLCG